MYLLRTLIDSVSQPYLYILGTTQCTLLMGAVVQPCNPLSLPLYTQTCPDFRCGFETNLHQKPALSAVAHSSCRQPTVANSSLLETLHVCFSVEDIPVRVCTCSVCRLTVSQKSRPHHCSTGSCIAKIVPYPCPNTVRVEFNTYSQQKTTCTWNERTLIHPHTRMYSVTPYQQPK